MNLRPENVTRRPGSIAIISQTGSKARGQTRIVPIPDDLADCLDVLATVAGKGKVFPYSRYTIDDWWEQLASAAGIEGVTLHGLRATYITHALDSGQSPTEVQKLVGHRHLSTTMKYYRNSQVSRKTALAINAALGLEGNKHSAAPQSHQLSHQVATPLVTAKA